MGERAKSEEMLMSCAGVQTAGGRVQVRGESESAATPMGQLAYFIEFLTLTGLWSRWQEGCPLAYTSPNAPILGALDTRQQMASSCWASSKPTARPASGSPAMSTPCW